MARRQVAVIDEQIEQLSLARRMMDATLSCVCPTVARCVCGAMDDVAAELRARYLPA